MGILGVIVEVIAGGWVAYAFGVAAREFVRGAK